MAGLLSRERIVAGPGFNRWLVPPAALAIHLSIGQAYAFSVFKLPLTNGPRACTPMVRPDTHWTQARARPGSSASPSCSWALGRGVRPVARARRAAEGRFVAALCLGGGFLVSALGVVCTTSGCSTWATACWAGCGLGLGYISPVSTLIKWFPDRRGHGDRAWPSWASAAAP